MTSRWYDDVSYSKTASSNLFNFSFLSGRQRLGAEWSPAVLVVLTPPCYESANKYLSLVINGRTNNLSFRFDSPGGALHTRRWISAISFELVADCVIKTERTTEIIDVRVGRRMRRGEGGEGRCALTDRLVSMNAICEHYDTTMTWLYSDECMACREW